MLSWCLQDKLTTTNTGSRDPSFTYRMCSSWIVMIKYDLFDPSKLLIFNHAASAYQCKIETRSNHRQNQAEWPVLSY